MGKKNLNIKLPEAMLDELEIIRRERSQQEGRRVSRNSLIEEAVEKYVTAAEKFLEGLFQEGNVKPDQPYQISVREFLGRHMDDRISETSLRRNCYRRASCRRISGMGYGGF